jgi:hypothetical protein
MERTRAEAVAIVGDMLIIIAHCDGICPAFFAGILSPVISCQLSVVGCWLLVVSCSLLGLI